MGREQKRGEEEKAEGQEDAPRQPENLPLGPTS